VSRAPQVERVVVDPTLLGKLLKKRLVDAAARDAFARKLTFDYGRARRARATFSVLRGDL